MKRTSSWTKVSASFRVDGQTSRFVDATCACGTVVRVRCDGAGVPRALGCRPCGHKRLLRHGASPYRRPTRTYTTWQGIRNRCENPKAENYADYGGRGIRICERWQVFENFLADMGEKPPGLSIERIDNNGNYEPGNCRWATRAEQNRNTRQNRFLEHGGRRMTVSEWAAHLGCRANTLFVRLRAGWSVAEALETPFGQAMAVRSRRMGRQLLTHNGLSLTCGEWAKRTGIGRTTIQERIRAGWSAEAALTTPTGAKA